MYIYIYIYKHTFVLLRCIIVLYGSFFPFLNFESFTSTRKKDTYLTSGSPCFGEPTTLPTQKVLLGSLRLLKDTSRSAFFLNCTTLFSGGLQRQALRQTLRKLRFLNQVLGIWAMQVVVTVIFPAKIGEWYWQWKTQERFEDLRSFCF